MDTKSVVARFEAERQALAMMDHPNIARVLDAGPWKGIGHFSSWNLSEAFASQIIANRTNSRQKRGWSWSSTPLASMPRARPFAKKNLRVRAHGFQFLIIKIAQNFRPGAVF